MEPAASAKPTFLPFKTALPCARSLKLTNKTAWEAFSKSGARPANVPSCPNKVYKHNAWQGWGHWLGTGNVGVSKDHKCMPFKIALLHARSLKLKNMREWAQWCKSKARPGNMPSAPNATHEHDGWQGCGHWLGTGNLRTKEFLPFKEALLHARTLKLMTHTEWMQWCKSGARLPNMPSHPETSYKHDGWQGYGHWLGTGNVGVKKDPQSLPFKKALLHARSFQPAERVDVDCVTFYSRSHW